ncbi:hypothetical protein BDN72DRAFT_961216 [Pluteus cervinus]|uniref:Uncharacterized protein n=1 Tax=Pluteus cervinus TaxID=181527 RepID=A0ACD3AMM1_9AGAR|nr:hypothetical protein BDN72DRAFT_961216 [Pluteus cervinus]
MMPATFSQFPPELEYEIFLFAFHNERDNPTNLLLVAKRIHDWLIPHIYKVVVFRTDRVRPPKASSSTLQLYGHHTRHLILRVGVTPIPPMDILSYCPNVEDLALWKRRKWSYSALSKTVNPLTSFRLKRLSIPITALQELAGSNTDIDVERKTTIAGFFSTITHLDVCSRVTRSEELSALSYCTSLTHLCIFASLPPQILRFIFDVCNKLEVLIWLMNRSVVGVPASHVVVITDEDMRTTLKGGGAGLTQDEVDKIAFIRCNVYGSDWERGANGGVDMWVLADRVVREAISSRKGIPALESKFGELHT